MPNFPTNARPIFLTNHYTPIYLHLYTNTWPISSFIEGGHYGKIQDIKKYCGKGKDTRRVKTYNIAYLGANL